MSSRPPCDQCGSTNFEEIDGITICEQGHHQEGGQRTGEDEDDFLAAGRVSRKKTEKTREKTIRVYRGTKGFRLYLKAWQFVLWNQCHALVQRLDLPKILWEIVKELWLLRMSQLVSRLDDNSEDHVQQDPTPASEAEVKVADNVGHHQGTSKPRQDITANPTLWDTIALNYLGILALRQPVPLLTIYRLVRNEQLCFIRAIRHVPEDIRERLAPEYHAALDTTTIPQKYELQNAVHRSAAMYNVAFGMIVPPLNWIPLLVSNIRKLSLPLEVFTAAKYIARTLHFGFSYLPGHERRKTSTSFPEAQLITIIIVATKLLFPLEGSDEQMHPFTLNEPTILRMDWNGWLESRNDAVSSTDHARLMGPKEAIEVTDRDVMSMNEEQMDQYMNWFEATYAKEPKNISNLNKEILEMFPLATLPADRSSTIEADFFAAAEEEEKTRQRLVSSQHQLTARHPIAEDDTHTEIINRPGQHYQRFRNETHMSELALTFYREAAELTCLDLDEVIRAVWRTERLLLLAQKERYRNEVFADDEDDDEPEYAE